MSVLPGEGEPGGPVLRSWDSLRATEVAARFILNSIAGHGEIVDKFMIDCMDLKGDEAFADAGTRDGTFPALLSTLGHNGPIHGVDIDDRDFDKMPEPNPNNFPISLMRSLGMTTLEDTSLILPKSHNLPILLKGDVNDLPFEDGSLDRLTVRKMLYHLTEEQQEEVFKEFIRVLKPDGMVIISTSGAENKYVHRGIEIDIQEFLEKFYPGILPPPHMNKGFTTQIAKAVLPEAMSGFDIYEREFISVLPITNEEEAEHYIGSVGSLYREYEPVPDRSRFDFAVDEFARKRILSDIKKYGQFVDFISESVFVVAKSKIDAQRLGLKQIQSA